MRKSAVSIWLVIIALFALTGCMDKPAVDEETTAIQFLNKHKYQLTSDPAEMGQYVLERSMLAFRGENQSTVDIWSLQKVSPEPYFGKTIKEYRFTVTNHPLKKMTETNTYVTVMMAEGKIIGGFSSPAPLANGSIFMGGLTDIEGKTVEEITGLTYAEWRDQWIMKYGEKQ